MKKHTVRFLILSCIILLTFCKKEKMFDNSLDIKKITISNLTNSEIASLNYMRGESLFFGRRY